MDVRKIIMDIAAIENFQIKTTKAIE